jgi:hypothetical protein
MPVEPAPELIDEWSNANSWTMIIVIAVLMVTWGALSVMAWKCRDWWPVALHCPACDARLDELGENPDRCPACIVRLR